VPVVLVGNKSDLTGDREVSVDEAVALAAKWNSRCIECSAKLNDNIVAIFNALLDQIDKDLAPPNNDKESSRCLIQ
jgi:Ras homolog enriched in brain